MNFRGRWVPLVCAFRMQPYHQLVRQYARLAARGKALPSGGFEPLRRTKLEPDAPRCLIFSPHPDDECIIGALPLRLLREARMNVINMAVTLGSKKTRRAARYGELAGACNYLGFGLIRAAANGLEKVTLESRQKNKAAW